MTMKRITHDRRLTPEETAKYKAVREQVAQELPELIARHHERIATPSQPTDHNRPVTPRTTAPGTRSAPDTPRAGRQ